MCIKNQIKPSLEITFFRPFPIMQHKMQHEKKETLKIKVSRAETVGFEPTDGLTRQLISSQPRYDHFGTSPK